MKIVTTKFELKETLREFRKKNISVGFVPTMGALHHGHSSLIKKSINDNDVSVVSIFVNPTQFGLDEDLSKYPRTLKSDLKICEILGVNIVFVPSVEEIYGNDEVKIISPNLSGFILEGFNRPHHFDGVLTVVLKLFHLVSPDNAYFGKKDAQQLILIKKMIENLNLNITIHGLDIVRDEDGLAVSSRNIYLNEKNRKKALALSKAIFKVDSLIKSEIRDIDMLKKEALDLLIDVEVQYLDFYTYDLHIANKLSNCILLGAIKVGTTRILDNLWIE